MIQKTTDYSIFKFRDDNREKISELHVIRLLESIKKKNLLDLRPITVNSKMEVMDGQHRLLAAERLNTPIFYEIREELDSKDIVILNVSKSWNNYDFLNFHLKSNNSNYIKLKEFMKKYEIGLLPALALLSASSRKEKRNFKSGDFIFPSENIDEKMEILATTVGFIKRTHPSNKFVDGSKFFRALTLLVTHATFDEEKWMSNLQKMIGRIGQRVTIKDYVINLCEIYNYRNNQRIHLLDFFNDKSGETFDSQREPL